ncbi:transmembrane amino acid transporter protein-domain-containing protein [Aspergillus egyptiacus]|nr:transmembrane amino acid transporter protein-domain-containing protein [Aspergillus egyptiacus]
MSADTDLEKKTVQVDAVFGEIQEGAVNYRDVGWKGTTVIMLKAQIGLGVLSIPQVFDTVGLIPGIIILLVISAMTAWSGWLVGVFKMRHPEVYGIDDIGRMLFGRVGYEVLGAMYALFWIFLAGSAMLSISISLNALSSHAICTAIFVAIAAIVAFVLSSVETLSKMSFLAWIGSGSVIVAVLTVTVAVGVQGHPPAINGVVPESDYKLFNNPSFADALAAISTVCLSYAGTPAFFHIMAEMREPSHYNRSFAASQVIITIMYVVCGTVVYYYCGSHVASPALGSAGPLMKKVCYGLALPGLIVSAVLMLHLPAKHIFVRTLRGSKHLTAHTPTHWIAWIGSTLTTAVIAYVIASGIPVFSSLVSLIGALFAITLCFQPFGCMWLYDNWHEPRTRLWWLIAAWSCFLIVGGTFLTVGGTYGSIVAIIDSYNKTGGSGAWSCANNDV